MLNTLSEIRDGGEAIDFRFPDVNGKETALSDFVGKVVYIDVWATWCGPCKQELPFFKQLEEEYRNKSYTVSDSEKYIFNPETLVKEGKSQLKENSDKKLYKWFEKNFEGHKGSVYGYTYNEKETEHLIFNIKQCENKLLKTFSKSKHIDMKGTRQDIFNNRDFENINEKNKEIYPFILAKYLEQLIKIEITKREVESAKYIKIKRTSKMIGVLVLLGVLMGACSNFFGSLIVQFSKEGEFLIAFFICFSIIISISVGTLVIHFLEKLLPKLIKDKT